MSRPISYGILLYPGFEVLDIAGPTECLNCLTHFPQGSDLKLAVIGRPVDEAHPDTPMELTPAAPDSKGLGVSFHSAQIYRPTHTFATAPPLDMLLIPGGIGSMPPHDSDPEINFVKSVYPSLKYLFTVCSGSTIASRAGVLDGRRATSNKAFWNVMTSLGAKTHWIGKARWVVSDNIWTTSGVSAGMDGMLAFLATVYDEETIELIVNGMEYTRVKDPNDDPFATIYGAEDVLPKE